MRAASLLSLTTQTAFVLTISGATNQPGVPVSDNVRVTSRIVYGGILASVLLNSFLTLVGRGGLLHFLAVSMAVMFIGVPALVVAACSGSARWLLTRAALILAAGVSVAILATFITGVVVAAIFFVTLPLLVVAAASYGGALRPVGRVGMLVAAVTFSALISFFTGDEVAKHDVAWMTKYCEALASKLDEYKRARGAYPRDLSPLLSHDRVAPSDLEYSSDGSRFTLSFNHPRRLLTRYNYSSQTRTWFVQH